MTGRRKINLPSMKKMRSLSSTLSGSLSKKGFPNVGRSGDNADEAFERLCRQAKLLVEKSVSEIG